MSAAAGVSTSTALLVILVMLALGRIGRCTAVVVALLLAAVALLLMGRSVGGGVARLRGVAAVALALVLRVLWLGKRVMLAKRCQSDE